MERGFLLRAAREEVEVAMVDDEEEYTIPYLSGDELDKEMKRWRREQRRNRRAGGSENEELCGGDGPELVGRIATSRQGYGERWREGLTRSGGKVRMVDGHSDSDSESESDSDSGSTIRARICSHSGSDSEAAVRRGTQQT